METNSILSPNRIKCAKERINRKGGRLSFVYQKNNRAQVQLTQGQCRAGLHELSRRLQLDGLWARKKGRGWGGLSEGKRKEGWLGCREERAQGFKSFSKFFLLFKLSSNLNQINLNDFYSQRYSKAHHQYKKMCRHAMQHTNI
jgi:hypothetical protein